jgi:hypothetical protein
VSRRNNVNDALALAALHGSSNNDAAVRNVAFEQPVASDDTNTSPAEIAALATNGESIMVPTPASIKTAPIPRLSFGRFTMQVSTASR